MIETILQINQYISSNEWFEMEALNYDGRTMTIAGGLDLLTGSYSLKLLFTDVCFVAISLESWAVDVNDVPIQILNGQEARNFNLKHKITKGNQIFKLSGEDIDMYVAAKSCSFVVGNFSY